MSEPANAPSGADKSAERLARENLSRQVSFLRSMVATHLIMDRPFISESLIQALQYHAVAGLNPMPGEYRASDTLGEEAESIPSPALVVPRHLHVPALMEDLVNVTNRRWDQKDEFSLAAAVLWTLFRLRPFHSGNLSTAVAAAYFVICIKRSGWLAGSPVLPERLLQDTDLLKEAFDEVSNVAEAGSQDLTPIAIVLERELTRQLESVE